MRLAIYFNPSAGVRSYDASDLVALLRGPAGGDEIRVFAKGRETSGDAIDWRPDVLVAAGGDGTVAEAATTLWARRSTVPLYVLPMGTSNNIAWTLSDGDVATVPALCGAIGAATERRFDVGVASAGEQRPFAEAAGFGFFGDVLRRASSVGERIRLVIRRLRRRSFQGDAHVRAAAAGIARHLRRAPSRPYAIMADGVDLSGRYVGVEAMNITAIGPRAQLAPNADTGDGALDLVLIREEDREPLARFLESANGGVAPPLDRRLVHMVEVRSSAMDGHVDDEPWPTTRAHGSSSDVFARVAVEGSVRILVAR